jgi:hypothetical protein
VDRGKKALGDSGRMGRLAGTLALRSCGV